MKLDLKNLGYFVGGDKYKYGDDTVLTNKESNMTTKEYRNAVIQMISRRRHDIAFTLTFDPNITETLVRHYTTTYFNQLDRKLRNRYFRHLEHFCGLERWVFLEQSHSFSGCSDYHIHGSMKLPDGFNRHDELIKWMTNDFKHFNKRTHTANIKPMFNQNRWHQYITKQIQQLNCDNLLLDAAKIDKNWLVALQPKPLFVFGE